MNLHQNYRQDTYDLPTKARHAPSRAFIVLIISFWLAACRIAEPTPASTEVAPPTTASQQPTLTPVTPAASPTPSLSATAEEETATPTVETPEPTATATPTPAPLRVAVIGDYGVDGQAEADVADLVRQWQPELIITTGDNNYPHGEADTIDANIGQYYASYIHPYIGQFGPGADENRFFPSLGNHDWNAPGLSPYLDYFTLPGNERYYEFRRGVVHFFSVDSDSREPDGVSRGSLQAAWLRDALAASEAPWKVVYMHHPPFSSASHGSIDWMKWPFAEWGATAVLAGHDHVYERIVRDGIVYFTNGLGGNPVRYNFKLLPVQGSKVRFNDDYGAMFVVADEHQITFSFVTRTGEIVDEYTLNAPSAFGKMPGPPCECSVTQTPQ
jgi:tartrate-resistant acid phosphatase type 5